MALEKLTHEEATARVTDHFKGRCAVRGDAYNQCIEVRLPTGPTGELHSIGRSIYVRPQKLQDRLNMLSRRVDEWEAKFSNSR